MYRRRGVVFVLCVCHRLVRFHRLLTCGVFRARGTCTASKCFGDFARAQEYIVSAQSSTQGKHMRMDMLGFVCVCGGA